MKMEMIDSETNNQSSADTVSAGNGSILSEEEAAGKVKEIEHQQLQRLDDRLLLYKEGRMEIYFAPHNLYISPKTEILLVGICPGKKQSEAALQAVAAGKGILEAKKQARFYGQTRKNLMDMLDALDVEKILHQPAQELLRHLDSGLDTIALIPFPVFINGKNYSGHSPALSHPLLQAYISSWFVPALKKLPHLKVLIPLGKGVEQALLFLQKEGAIPPSVTILQGFPHPSGLNASRARVFEQNKQRMQSVLHQVYKQ